jgi:hypothetical protein
VKKTTKNQGRTQNEEVKEKKTRIKKPQERRVIREKKMSFESKICRG